MTLTHHSLVFFGVLLLISAGCATAAPAPPSAAFLPSLNWVPCADWVNVKALGAVGDGVADDTAAIQKALDGVTHASTVYLPAGTYRLTDTLRLKGLPGSGTLGFLLVGNGRDTRLMWDGPEGGIMFLDDGVPYSRYVGMIFDGKGRAAVGFNHNNSERFETEVRHQNMGFLNCTDTGLLVDPGRVQATAETLVENCLFENCTRGCALLRFNEYDWTFDGCEFRGCEIGVQCDHGNTYVRNTHFEGSKTVDILLHPEHGCSIRRCTSVGSRAFVDFYNSVAPVTIQDCRVEGWTNPDWAVSVGGGPAMIFDCVFTRPPGPKPPILSQGGVITADPLPKGGYPGGQRMTVSQNVSAETEGVYNVAQGAKLYEVPAGQRQGVLTSAQQRFLKDVWPVPTKVCDAQRDFGAKGDGNTDDTAAIQQTIDAARTAGKGALAYLPGGFYVIKDTLRITGADYSVGGTGFKSALVWRGPEGGTMVAIEDPMRVTLENLSIGNHDSGQMNNAVDVLQTTTGKPALATYDNVSVFGMYQKEPFRKGLWLQGLGPNATVLMRHVQGNIRIVDSAQATILANTSYEGSVTVEGKGKQRSGFTGFLTHLGTICTHSLYVKDNHSFVASDFYVEQADNGFSLEGAADDPTGRVTLQGPKFHFTPLQDGAPNIPITIDNYSGEFFLGPEQFYIEPVVMKLQHQGDRPLDMFLVAASFYNSGLEVQQGPGLHLWTIGSQRVPPRAEEGAYDAADKLADDTLKKLAGGLDDLRRLGEVDMRLNHPAPAPR